MTEEEIKIGIRVKNNIPFFGIPKATQGVIDEDYGSGIMVAWDGPAGHAPLPEGYSCYDGKPTIRTKLLRDGFDKNSELHFLDLV